jgi:micrococcal nuclease
MKHYIHRFIRQSNPSQQKNSILSPFVMAAVFSFFSFISVIPANLAIAASAVPMAQALKDLHADVPASCELMSTAPRSEGGPFEKTSMCADAGVEGNTIITATVYRVLDGDTIHVRYNNQVFGIRMLGVDTPELHYLAKAQPKWGESAKKVLHALLKSGDTVKLELDQQACDKYGRILAHVWKGNKNINAELIRRGAAMNYCIHPNVKHCTEYSDLVHQAQARAGTMYQDPCLVTPYVWRKAMEGKLMERNVQDIRTGKTYYPEDYHRVPLADRLFY